MSALVPLIYAHFLIAMGPAIVITAALIRRIKRENFKLAPLPVDSGVCLLGKCAGILFFWLSGRETEPPFFPKTGISLAAKALGEIYQQAKGPVYKKSGANTPRFSFTLFRFAIAADQASELLFPPRPRLQKGRPRS